LNGIWKSLISTRDPLNGLKQQTKSLRRLQDFVNELMTQDTSACLLCLALGHSSMEHDAGDGGPMRTGQTAPGATQPHPEDNPPWHGHEQRSGNHCNPDDILHDASAHISDSTSAGFNTARSRTLRRYACLTTLIIFNMKQTNNAAEMTNSGTEIQRPFR